MIALINFLADSPSQRIVSEHNTFTLTAAVLVYAYQALFGVVLEVLYPVTSNPFFAQSPKSVIAVALVLIDQHTVVLD
ncbi:hypothetical protein D3C79_676960 [compost metagenome]